MSVDITWKEIIPSILGCTDEVTLKQLLVGCQIDRVAEIEVIWGWVFRVGDAAEEFVGICKALHSKELIISNEV